MQGASALSACYTGTRHSSLRSLLSSLGLALTWRPSVLLNGQPIEAPAGVMLTNCRSEIECCWRSSPSSMLLNLRVQLAQLLVKRWTCVRGMYGPGISCTATSISQVHYEATLGWQVHCKRVASVLAGHFPNAFKRQLKPEVA